MKTNEILQKDVQDALKWEPLLHAAEIGVIVKDGVVTLTGTVDSYAKKIEAEQATKMVSGVKALVEKIEIKYGNYGKKSDEDIANEIINAFKWNWSIPDEKIKVKVENGWVTLTGIVIWNYQKEASNIAIKNLLGVVGITNNIHIQSESKDKIEKLAIENALVRNWSINDDDIHIEVKENNVTLSGTVDSYYEKEEAERIAWNAPGVTTVNNELELYF
jgi:osmotically-inducible protein OsmY